MEQASLPIPASEPETREQALAAAFAKLPRKLQRAGLDALMSDEATRKTLDLAARARLRKARPA